MRVYADGRRRRDLHILDWELLPAPHLGRCRVMLGGDIGGQLSRMERIDLLPPIGSRIELAPNSTGPQFLGIVTEHKVECSAEGEMLVAQADHELVSLLSPLISSLHQANGAGATSLARSAVVFNHGQAGLCSRDPVTVGGRQARLFDASVFARPWSVADALGYLLATAVPPDVHTPALAELDNLARQIDLGVLNVTGMTVMQALVEIAARGGLAMRAAVEGLGIVFYRPGMDGIRRRVGLQPAGEQVSLRKTNLLSASVTFSRRPSLPGVLAIGGPKRYECSFELSPGWDSNTATSRWRDCVRSLSGDWPRRADVYRKWVLNEHGWYSQAPWNLPTNSLAQISPDFALLVPRRLLPCLSTKPGNESQGVVVEVSIDGETWRRWRGPLWVSRDECAVYLGGDALPGEFFAAAVGGQAMVRVTATIEADARLTAQLDGNGSAVAGSTLPVGFKVLNMASRAGWAKVHESSVFCGRDDIGRPNERDDSLMLLRLAQCEAQAAAAGTQADLRLAWIDTSLAIGDVVASIEGRDLDLGSWTGAMPSIASVKHDFTAQTTHLIVRG